MSQLEQSWKDWMRNEGWRLEPRGLTRMVSTRICYRCAVGRQYGWSYDLTSVRLQATSQVPYELCARCHEKAVVVKSIMRHRNKLLRDVRRRRRDNIRHAIWRTS